LWLTAPAPSAFCGFLITPQNGVFVGVLLQGVAYALLFVFFYVTCQDGWDTNMVVFGDVIPGNAMLGADVRGHGGAPVPPPKDYSTTAFGAMEQPGLREEHRHSSFYDDPHI